MCDPGRGRSVIRSSTRKHWRNHCTRSEFATNISLSWAEDENRTLTQPTRRGATLHFVATPITWKQNNYTQVSSASSLSLVRRGLPRPYARRRFGGVVIVR